MTVFKISTFLTKKKICAWLYNFYCSLFVPVYSVTADTGHLERYWVTISFWGNREKTSPSVLPHMQIGMLWQLTASLLFDQRHQMMESLFHAVSSQPNFTIFSSILKNALDNLLIMLYNNINKNINIAGSRPDSVTGFTVWTSFRLKAFCF